MAFPGPTEPVQQGRLPSEIILLIVEHAALGDIASVVRLSGVCRWCRQLIVGTPSFWQDVRSIELRSSQHDDISAPMHPAERRSLSLLKLCEDRSKSAFTHANFGGLSSRHSFKQCLQLLHGSKNTLEYLEISDMDLCHCSECFPDPDHAAASPRAVALAHFFETIGSLRNLQCLRFEFSFFHKIDLTALGAETVARPKTVILEHWDECGCDSFPTPSWQPEHRSFLDKLTSETEHFKSEREYGDFGHDYEEWMWSMFARRSADLQTCTFPVRDPTFLLPPIDFAQLREATIRPSCSGLSEQMYDAIRAPALRSLCTDPEFALTVHCPELTAAWLMVQNEDDWTKLPQALAKWPQLDTLTIVALDQEFFEDWDVGSNELATAALTPSVHGKILAPKLRHLGLMQLTEQDWLGEHAHPDGRPHRGRKSASSCFGPFMANLRCPQASSSWRKNEGDSRKGKT